MINRQTLIIAYGIIARFDMNFPPKLLILYENSQIMVSFDFNILFNPIIIALLGASLFATLWLSIVYCRRISSIRRHARTASEEIPSSLPDISIIVYSKDSSKGLAKMLPQVLAQEYAGQLEVIVTTDGRSPYAEDVVKLLSPEHRNLRMTYVPDEAHALSRRKLAMTLGMKAARFDCVLLTDANCIVSSPRWLSLMARHFANGKEVVIGACNPIGAIDEHESASAAFNTLADSVTYLSSAVAGTPYRGNEHNLAFLRRKFFDNHGFAKSVGYHHGIDDIFISQIADKTNTSVEISPEAILDIRCQSLSTRHQIDKLQHLFTGRYVSRGSRRLFGFSSAMMWLWLGATVALGTLGRPNVLPLASSTVFGITWIVIATVRWRRAAATLGIRVNAALLPVLIFARPFSNLIYRIRARFSRSANYTWAKGY